MAEMEKAGRRRSQTTAIGGSRGHRRILIRQAHESRNLEESLKLSSRHQERSQAWLPGGEERVEKEPTPLLPTAWATPCLRGAR
jgi:hypothetical protein